MTGPSETPSDRARSAGPVACALDVHDYDRDVIEMAASLATALDTELDLIYVTPVPSPSQVATPGNLGLSSELDQDEQLLAGICPAGTAVKVNHRHWVGDPMARIQEYIATWSPQMLIVGTHARRGMASLFGSVATSLLRVAACPVLIYRMRRNSQNFHQLEKKVSP